MSWITFFKQLILVSLLTAFLLFLIHLNPEIAVYSQLSWVSCIFYILLSIFIFFFAYRAAFSENKNAFTIMIMSFVLAKMVFSVTFVLVYFQIIKPESSFFLVPFFVVYLIYTIFETYFMTKLARINPDKKSPITNKDKGKN